MQFFDKNQFFQEINSIKNLTKTLSPGGLILIVSPQLNADDRVVLA